MSFTYDLSTDIGKFRAIFPDTNGSSPLFSDEEIAVFLEFEGGLRRAKALALQTAASDLVLTLRVTETLGLKVDGASAGRVWRRQAQSLRELADADEDKADSASGANFDWAEMALDTFSTRELLNASALRSGV